MTAAQNRLMALTKELLAEWTDTKQYWRDAKSTEFEKRYLDELESAVNIACANLEPLERVLKQIHDDCD
jgi:hypothetical protein